MGEKEGVVPDHSCESNYVLGNVMNNESMAEIDWQCLANGVKTVLCEIRMGYNNITYMVSACMHVGVIPPVWFWSRES